MNNSRDIGLLILRLWLGLNMAFSHGLGKLQNANGLLNGLDDKFPFPVFMGVMAILSEFAAALLVATGLFTRISAFFVMMTMLGAGFVIHAGDPWGRKEFALTYAVISLFLVLVGPGRYSLDAMWRGVQTEGES